MIHRNTKIKLTTSAFQEERCSSEFVPYLLSVQNLAVVICTTTFNVQILYNTPLECARVLYGSHNKQQVLPYSAIFDWILGVFAKLQKGIINVVMKRERERENQQDATIRCLLLTCLNMFRASLCPSLGEQRPCYCIWCVVLVLLDVVGSGCGALLWRM